VEEVSWHSKLNILRLLYFFEHKHTTLLYEKSGSRIKEIYDPNKTQIDVHSKCNLAIAL